MMWIIFSGFISDKCTYSYQWAVQTALHPVESRPDLRSEGPCDLMTDGRTRTSLWEEPNIIRHSNKKRLTLQTNTAEAAVAGRCEVVAPCLRLLPSLRKQLPSQRRLSRCCLISSRISGWIRSRSSLTIKKETYLGPAIPHAQINSYMDNKTSLK